MSIIIDGQSLRNHINFLRRQTSLLNKKIENLSPASGGGSGGIMPAPSSQGANISIANLPVKDEDNMASNSDIHLVTQQSVKQFALPLAGGVMTGPLTVGVDDTGHDVKFFGATSGAYLLWDESADKLLTAGGTTIDIVKDKLLIGGTAVTTTAAELNVLDGIPATLTATEIGYVDGVTSAIQTQLDAKLPLSGGAMTGAITTNSTFDGRDVSADGDKLDNIEANAQVNVDTNLGKTTAAGQITITSSTGTDVVIGEATDTIAGLMSTTHHDKLDGIAASANNYSLPIATGSALGGIKVGSNLTIDSSTGVLNAGPIALTTVQTAGSEAAQLALTVQEGDVVVRTDQNKSYIRNSGTADDMTDFQELLTPTDAVLSVTTTDGTYINLTPNTATTGAINVTADLSAADGTADTTTRFLSKDNTWDVPAYTSNTFRTIKVDTNDDGTANETIGATEELKLIGGTAISLEESAGVVTINGVAETYTAHDNISAASSVDNSGRTYIQDITLDSNGHVTGLASATETVTNTNQLTTFTIRDDDDDDKVIAQDKFIKFVAATGTLGTNWSGAGTTGDPWVMTITSPNDNTFRTVKVDTNGDGSANNTLEATEDLMLKKGSNITLAEADGVVTISSTATGTVDGSGTANDVVMWSDSDTLTDAPIAISSNDATFAGNIQVDGKNIGIGGAPADPTNGTIATKLDLKGSDDSIIIMRGDTASTEYSLYSYNGDFMITRSNQSTWWNSPDFKLNGGNATFAGNIQANGTVTVGADTSGNDVTFYGAGTGEKMFWDSSESTLQIYHDTADTGLEIFTVSSATQDVPQLKVGRNVNEYWGVSTSDRTAQLVHRQDEASGAMKTVFTQWDSNTSDTTGYWQWTHCDEVGANCVAALTLYQSGNATFAGVVDATNFKINGAQGTDGQVLTSTGSGVAWEDVPAAAIDGSGTANDVVMWSDSDTLTDAPIAISGNNAIFAGDVGVGVGTTPAQTLEIHNPTTTDYTDFGLKGTGHKYVIGVGNDSVATVNDKLYFYDNDNTAFRLVLDTAGKISIGGTHTATSQVHIKNTSGDNRGLIVENTVAASYAELAVKSDIREFRLGTGGNTTSANASNVFYVYDATTGGTAGHRFEISEYGDVQARRTRSNNPGEVALSLQPTDSTIHYGFRIDTANNYLNIDRVDSAINLMILDYDGNATFTGNIRAGGTAITANTNFDNLVIEGVSHTGISIISGSTGTDSDGGIYFGDQAANNLGQIKYLHASNSMTFATNDGSASLTLDSGLNATFAGDIALGGGSILTTHSGQESSIFLDNQSSIFTRNDSSVGSLFLTQNFYYGSDGNGKAIETGYSNVLVLNREELNLYFSASSVSADATTSLQEKFKVTKDGNATFAGTISATNFSGSSSGTNTGDQDLSSLATVANPTFTGDITIPEYIYHTGDTNTKFGFSGDDTYKVITTGQDALTIDSNQFAKFEALVSIEDGTNPDGSGTSSGVNSGGTLTVEGRRDGTANLLCLRARDNTGSTLALPDGQGGLIRWQGFDGTDFAQMGAIAVNADGQAVANGDSPSKMIFYTVPDNTETLTPALTLDKSQNATFAGNVTIPEYVYHDGDTDTKFGFSGADTYVVAAGGTSTLQVSADVVESSGIFAAGNGVVGAPAFTFTSDLNTGIYRTGADSIGFATGGSVALTIGDNDATFAGKVGVGVSPTTLLHLNGTGDAIRVESTNAGAGGAQMDLLHFTASPADEDTHGMINMGGYYTGTTSVYGSQILSKWTDVSERHSRLEFKTCDTTLSTVLTLDHAKGATFTGYVVTDGQVGVDTYSPYTGTMLHASGASTSPDTSAANPADTTAFFTNSDIAYGTLFATHGSGIGEIMQRRTNAATYYDLHLQPHGGEDAGLGIGGSVDAGFKFQVNGNSKFSGANTVADFTSSSTYSDIIFRNSAGVGGFVNFNSTTSFNVYVGGGSGSDHKLSLTNAGLLTVTGDVVAYGSPSDISLKENIKPIDNALDKVSKLKGVTFDWKKSDSILKIKEDIGFIAQDVKEVLPDLVRTNDDGKLSLRDKGIIPVLVEAIKELEARVKELENK